MDAETPPAEPEPEPEPEEKKPVAVSESTRRSQRAQLGSIIAVVLSVIALGLNLYQTRLLQVQARASVWPHLAIGFSYHTLEEKPGFTVTVDNNGVGPAIVKSVRVTFDGQPLRTWPELFGKLLEHGTVSSAIVGIAGEVIPASTNRETRIQAIFVGEPDYARKLFEARDRLKIDICYCSVYDDCWVAHWLTRDVDSVGSCASAGDAEFLN